MWAWRLLQTFPKPHVLEKRGAMTQMFFVYNSGSNYSIFVLIVALESAWLSLSTVRKALESDKNCGRDVLYKFSEASRFRKTDAMTRMFFVYNSISNHSIFSFIVALESAGLSLSTAKKALESDKNCGRDVFNKLSRSLTV